MNTSTFKAEAKNIESFEQSDYKVSNAVILAAGITPNTIYAPPKGLFLVDGIPIIEHLIRQLKDVGINEIYVVVGYKKEMYFYLEEKYNVTLIGNPRLDKNNVYSLFLARQVLGNTYVCACDYIFKKNPFSNYEAQAYHGTAFFTDARNKFAVTTNAKGRITSITAGAQQGECIHGIAYFDKEFSKSFVHFLENEINNYRIDSLFWQEFFARHIADLDLYTKHFDTNDVLEVDCLDELKRLSLLFVDSVSTQIVENICKQLHCEKNDISDVDILQAGHSNITFKIAVKGKDYVYRYPGVSSKNIVSREREIFSNQLGKHLGIDNTFLFANTDGHKLSTFVANAHPLDPNNRQEIGALAKLVKKLHDFEITEEQKIANAFNPLEEADRLLNLACATKDDLFKIFYDIRQKVHQINAELDKDKFKKAVCHCNLNSNNCLITDTSFDMIDWEFSGYCDIAYDFPFLGNYDFREEDLYAYLTDYYGREPLENEYRHWVCYRAIHYWYYTCWAIYKESVNEDCGNLLLVFYEDCKKAVNIAKRYITME